MNNILEAQKVEILNQLKGSVDQMKEAGIGRVLNVENMPVIDIDLSEYPFIPEGSKVVRNNEKYFIMSSENELLYLGNIDEQDGDNTVAADLEAFPRLTEISILLGQEKFDEIDEKISNPMYLMVYCNEMMMGLMKSHENGHIDLEAEISKALS